MASVSALLVVLLFLAAAWLLCRARARGGAANHAEARLLRICRGDAARAERLVAGELARAPGISRAEAAARAVETYRRDNR